MLLSIIIPAFFGEEILEKCLETLNKSAKNKIGRDWEILVFNNGFSPKRWRELKEIYPQIKFFGKGENLGFAKGNNFLWQKSRGKYILMINQDVFITKKNIDKLIKFLEKNPQYSCVAPKLVSELGEAQFSCRPFPRGFWFLLSDFFSGGKKYRYFYSPLKSRVVEQPMASCLLWRQEILKKLKGFDEHPHFFLYFNDVDLSYRLSQIKGKSYFLASAEAVHLHGQSAFLLKELKRLSLWYKGLGRFWFKMNGNFFGAYFCSFGITFLSGLMKTGRFLVGDIFLLKSKKRNRVKG